MSRPSRPWFRFYTEAMGDQKLRTLTPTLRWLWVGVLAASRVSPEPGVLLIGEGIPHTASTLADFAAVKEREVEAGMVEFQKRGMVDLDLLGTWSVPKFSERQYESDSSTPRTRKHRSHEHDGNVPKAVPGTHQRTETETEPSGGGEPPPDIRIQSLVAGYVDDYRTERQGRQPSREWRSSAGSAVKRALSNGDDPDAIARCLGVIAHEGKNPSTLPHVLSDYYAKRPRRVG